jgi:hypothetical protein
MSLPVKDGGGNNVTLVSSLISGEHAVHHVMMGSDGTTLRVLKTTTDGTVVMSGAVTVTGGATEAKQDAANASLDSIDGGLADFNAKVPAAATLADNTANPSLSAIASYTMVFDGSTWDRWDRSVTMTGVGLPGDSAAASDTESTGLVGLTKRLLQRISTLIGGLPAALGQTNSAGSFPVVIANNQSAVPVTGTFFQGTQPVSLASLPALPTGSNTIGTVNLGTIADVATQTTLAALNAKVTAVNTGAVVISAAIPAGSNNIGDVDVLSLPALPAGSNNIGDVDVLSLPALPAGSNNIGDVDVLSLPATPTGSNVIGSVAARLDASSMSDGAGTALVPKFAAIAAASSGDNTIIAAVSSKKIRVLAFRLKAAAASSATVACYWRNGAGGSALEGGASNTTPLDKTGAAGAGGETAQFNPVGWFETSANTALVLNLSAAQAVTGSITYVEV